MTTKIKAVRDGLSEKLQGGYAAPMMIKLPGYPQVVFDKPNEGEGGNNAAAEEADVNAAAEAAAAALAEAEASAAADDTSKEKAELVADKKALLADVMSKKAKLKETNEALAAAQEKLKSYEGVDPKKYAELVKKEQDAEVAAATAAGDFERVKTMMAEQHRQELADKDAQIEALRQASGSAAKTIDALTIGADFSGSKYIAENLTLSPTKARVIYGGHFETKDGKTVGYDKPAGETNRTLLVDSSGEPLSFDKAFEKIVQSDPDKNSVLKANVKPGSGGKTIDADTKKAPNPEDVPYGRDLIARQFFKDGQR